MTGVTGSRSTRVLRWKASTFRDFVFQGLFLAAIFLITGAVFGQLWFGPVTAAVIILGMHLVLGARSTRRQRR
jgi:CHASE2 domain-containing sensor protein